MKKIKFAKLKLVGLFGTAILLGIPSLEREFNLFSLTAPTDTLMRISCDYLSKKFAPNQQDVKFINLVMSAPSQEKKL